MFMKIAAGAIAVLLITNVATGWLLKRAYEDIGTLKTNVATAEAAVKEQRETLVKVQKLYEEQAARADTLSKENEVAVVERNEAISALNEFRTKIHRATVGRPTLVQRLANRKTKAVMCDVWRATGGEGECPQ